MTSKKSGALILTWVIAATALIFNQSKPPFTLLDQFSSSHLTLLSIFILSSIYLLANQYRIIGFIHLLSVAVLFILHPYSELFGRDGTPFVLGLYFVCFVLFTPLLKNEHKLLATTLLVCVVLTETLLPKWLEGSTAATKGLKEWANFVDGYRLHEGGYFLPQIDTEIVGEFGPSAFKTNNAGFRYARDTGYEKPEGTLRLIFIGDSFAAGYRTDQKDTIGYRLEQGLGEALADNVEVLIAGVHDTTWAARYIEGFALKFNPDLVIVGITMGNDISGGYVTASGQRFKDERIAGSLLPETAFDVSGLRGALLRLDRNLSSWEIYRLVRRAIRDDPIISWYNDYPQHVHTLDIYHALGYFYTNDRIVIVDESFHTLEQTLIKIKTTLGRAGVEFMVVLFPQRFQVRSEDWTSTLYSYGLHEDAFDMNAPNNRILKFCDLSQLNCLDVLSGVRQSNNEALFLPLGDMHFNRAGQRMTAEIIQGYILRNRLLTN